MMSFIVAAPTSVAAQTDLPVSGVLNNGGTFSGTLLNAEFVTSAEDPTFLIITGQLQGSAVIDGVSTSVNVSVEHIAFTEDSSDCEEIHVIISPIALDDSGTEVQLDRVIFRNPEQGLIGGLLSGGNGVFCAVDDLLGTGQAEDLADTLNDLLDEVGL